MRTRCASSIGRHARAAAQLEALLSMAIDGTGTQAWDFDPSVTLRISRRSRAMRRRASARGRPGRSSLGHLRCFGIRGASARVAPPSQCRIAGLLRTNCFGGFDAKLCFVAPERRRLCVARRRERMRARDDRGSCARKSYSAARAACRSRLPRASAHAKRALSRRIAGAAPSRSRRRRVAGAAGRTVRRRGAHGVPALVHADDDWPRAAHAIDCALGDGIYRSCYDPKIRAAFATARSFVTPYAASGLDEYFAECVRAYSDVFNDANSPWPPATRERLSVCDPAMHTIVAELRVFVASQRRVLYWNPSGSRSIVTNTRSAATRNSPTALVP